METKVYSSPHDDSFQVHTIVTNKEISYYGDEVIRQAIAKRVVDEVAKRVIEDHGKELAAAIAKRLNKVIEVI